MVDRPGFGGSDLVPGRSLSDFAADVRELADALGLERFSILGVSAGAPYALACAAAMPERVAAVASVSTIPPSFSPRRSGGTVPYLRAPLMLLRGRPSVVKAIMDRVVALARARPGALRALFSIVVKRDTARERTELTLRRFLDTIARGSEPMIQDFLICCRPWDFDLSRLRTTVHLWHGLRDSFIPAKAAHNLSKGIPDCRLRLPEAGHLFLREWIGPVLRPLVEAATPAEGVGEGEKSISRRLAA
jgi:pimeloyl-ACP methyl ester carboxylesterase